MISPGPTATRIVAVLYNDPRSFEDAKERLIGLYGPIIDSSKAYEFNYTDYYQPEMSSGLNRVWLIFKDAMKCQDLPEFKFRCWQIEKELSKEAKRSANIDPGYMTDDQIVLASFKYRPHKVYIKDEVYGDIVLIYRDKHWKPLETTFPDLRSDELRSFFLEIKEKQKHRPTKLFKPKPLHRRHETSQSGFRQRYQKGFHQSRRRRP